MDKRAAIFAALAQGLDLPGVRERFDLTPEDLQELFRDAADPLPGPERGLLAPPLRRGLPGQSRARRRRDSLFDPQGRLRVNTGRYLGETTNNVAEYQALLLGLEEARKMAVKKLRIFADSELMVKQLNGRYRVKAPHLIPLWREALNALKKFEAWAIAHVPREENHLADEAANRAIDQKTAAG